MEKININTEGVERRRENRHYNHSHSPNSWQSHANGSLLHFTFSNSGMMVEMSLFMERERDKEREEGERENTMKGHLVFSQLYGDIINA